MRNLSVFLVVLVLIVAIFPVQKALGWGTETIGNEPLVAANYTGWPRIMPLINDKTRVYATWTNGNEFFYYKGSTDEVNAALGLFAAVGIKNHTVLLRPGSGLTATFDHKDLPYNWNLHVMGGISKHESTLDKAEAVWPKDPVLTIYIGGDIYLNKLRIPDGVTVTETIAVSKRTADGMAASKDNTVRGRACGELAGLDHYSIENMNAIAGMLKDSDDWVRGNAALCLAHFGKKAVVHLPALRECLKSSDLNLKKEAEEVIAKIENAPDTSEEEKRYVSAQKTIADYVETRVKDAGK
jgi:hypothetical protein